MSNIKVMLRQVRIAAKVVKNEIVAKTVGAVVNINQSGGGSLVRTFTAGDFEGGELLIGTIGANRRISQTVILIHTALSDGSWITIGTNDAQGILAGDGDVANAANMYVIENHLLPDESAEYKIFFHGSPVSGAGTVIVYFS